jgi:hypothetical protein
MTRPDEAARAFGAALLRYDEALAAEDLLDALEEKAGYDPNQPREPAGRARAGAGLASRPSASTRTCVASGRTPSAKRPG